MDREPTSKPYLPSRMVDYRQFSLYYAYGNRPAEDLLEHVHPEDDKTPTILSLGCGDPRSFFYTLWKHFTPSLSERHFFGARFILNDISAAILARNILFLYLAVKIPPWTQREAAKQWISSMWAIWYCHELLPIHEETLKEALTTLLKLSDTMKSWEVSQHAISQVVSFTDDGTRAAVRRMWDMWLTKSFKLSKSNEMAIPLFEQTFVNVMQDWYQAIGLTTYTTKAVSDAMFSDFNSYILEHSAYAEECLNIPYSTEIKAVNPTLFERDDGSYTCTLPLGSSPFVGFHHGIIFSKLQIQRVTGGELSEPALIVEDDAFVKHPMLSNSVQQFSMWVSSSAATLMGWTSQHKPNITLAFNCSDCLLFCEELQNKLFQNLPLSFDTIFTANLIDYLPPPLLVLAIKPLLKMTSYLLTTSFHYRKLFSSTEQYLFEIFGVSSSLLPLLFGIRCVGHDGEYADGTAIIPIPIQLRYLLTGSNLMLELNCRMDKVLYWQRVNSQPVVMRSLKDSPSLSTSLHTTLFAQMWYFYRTSGDLPIVLCTETAVNSILSFISQLDADVDINNYMFWDDFCALLRSNTHLRPFLVHIQTQALLHGLHFHLTLTDTNCPICLKKPLKEHISQFSIEFDPLSMDKLVPDQGMMPVFVVFIHKARVDPRMLINHDQHQPTDHIVDSAQGLKLASGKVRLSFFFPVRFVEESYFYTVVRYVDKTVDTSNRRAVPVATVSGNICQVRFPFSDNSFYFKQAGAGRIKSSSCSLGTILSHVGDNDHMETVLSLASKPLALLSAKTARIKFENPSPSTIQVVCGKYNFVLTLPYPVDYSKIQNSRSQGTVWIKCPRKHNHFYDEKCVVITNPSCLMMFPTTELPTKDIAKICNMQYLKEEKALLDKIPNFREFKTNFPTFPASVRVKLIVSWLFNPEHNFVAYAHPTSIGNDDVDPYAYLLIHRRAVDVQRCTPVVEVYYLDYSDVPLKRIEEKLYALLTQDVETSKLSQTTPIDKNTWSDLKQVLMYFARCTLPTSKNLPHLLCKHGLEKHFTRAIVYPLYFDQDVVHANVDSQVPDLMKRMSTVFAQSPRFSHSTASSSAKAASLLNSGATKGPRLPVQNGKGCSYCGRKSDELKKCIRCGEAWYCDRQCQAGHWKDHKKICKPPVKKATKSLVTEEFSTKCSNCGKEAENLKRCGTCQVAAYCSKECQRNDWTRHKSECMKK